ncbi:MAG: FecR family protein [Verrucomicrobiota bacterium]
MKSESRIRELTNDWCSGNLDAESKAELEELLRENPEHRRLFLEYRAMESALRPAASIPAAAPAPSRRGWQSYAITGLAACFVALLAGVLIFWPDRPESIATLTGNSGAVLWTGDGGEVSHDLATGEDIGGGTLETLAADAWAEIAFPDGTTLAVSGHSAITISEQDGQKIMRLREGSLSVEAAKQPAEAPILLMTPSAEATILGTQLNVSVDDFATLVVVNEGLVEVERLADGSIQKVPEQHQVVAALETGAEFMAVPRLKFVEVWKSNLPHDRRYGEWRPHSNGLPGAQQARPMLWREEPERPMLLHVASIDPSPNNRPPVQLTVGSSLRIEGRLNRSFEVIFGLTAWQAEGGFAGKYSAVAAIDVASNSDGRFQIELPIEKFERLKEVFSPSPLGRELADFWAVTITEDVGLEIISVELLKQPE